jgi:hypothetical protein
MRMLVVAGFVVLAIAAPLAAAMPSLRVADEAPLIVRGSGFKAGEKVRVWLTLTTGRRYRDTLAAAAGGFSVRFTVTPAQCPLVRSLTAVGSRGSRATRSLRLDCQPPPPLAP